VTTQSCNNCATALSRPNKYTCDCIYLNAYYCLKFSGTVGVRFRARIRFSVWLASGYAHVFVLLSVVMVTLPHMSLCLDCSCI